MMNHGADSMERTFRMRDGGVKRGELPVIRRSGFAEEEPLRLSVTK
jgi:hypothetical protein